MPNILVACSGSVAVLKVPEILLELNRAGFKSIRVLLTKSAEFFWDRAHEYNAEVWAKCRNLQLEDIIFRDEDEWGLWDRKGDPVLHIELRKWADVLVLCPASADILAKIRAGIADNLLLCTLRAWDFEKPVLLCPCMNTVMWQQPITEETISSLLTRPGWHCLSPVVKTLACNEVGIGALPPVSEVVSAIIRLVDTIADSNCHGADSAIEDVVIRNKKKKRIEESSLWSPVAIKYVLVSFLSAGVASLLTWRFCMIDGVKVMQKSA
jgi:phosphopantothenoylcysteine decarboxylase